MNNKPSIKRVCVYAASSQLIHQQYFDESKLLGKILAQNNIEVQYGGGYTGCMGALADSMLEHNGSIIGISIESFLSLKEFYQNLWMTPNGDIQK